MVMMVDRSSTCGGLSAPSSAVSLRQYARTSFAAPTRTGVFCLPQSCSAGVQNDCAHTPRSSVLLQTDIYHIPLCIYLATGISRLALVPSLAYCQTHLLVLAITIANNERFKQTCQSRDSQIRQAGTDRADTDTDTGTCHRSKTPTLDSTESIRRDGVRWDDEMRRVRYHARMHHARLASAGGRLAPDPSPLFLRPPIPSHKRCAARSGI